LQHATAADAIPAFAGTSFAHAALGQEFRSDIHNIHGMCACQRSGRCGMMLPCRPSISTAAGCTAIFWVRKKAKGGLTMQFAKPLRAAFALGSMIALPAHAELDVASLKQSIETSFESEYPKLDALYKDIHAHPEIAFQEEKTAAKLAAEMRAIGFEVTEKVGKTGLVALYKNGDGPTIMVRTELDALPMEEKTGLPYASRDKAVWQGGETFVTHSCGHDVHMATWIGTAKMLVGLKGRWKGTLMFIAQPAEEAAAGARAMLADGLFTRFPKPDAGFALHAGAFPYSYVSYAVGVRTSNADGLYIKFKGSGGHGAMPQATIDPVMMASRFVVDVQSVISREKDPTEFGVVPSARSMPGPRATSFPTRRSCSAPSEVSNRTCAPRCMMESNVPPKRSPPWRTRLHRRSRSPRAARR
jgi:hypothetical protein